MSRWGKLLSLLFPDRCAMCGKILSKEGRFCPACESKQSLVPDEKMVKEGTWGKCVSVLWYDELTREAVHALKFRGQDWRAETFGEMMARAAAEHLSGEFDAVTWVPVSRKRLKERGYDQSRLLAERMAKLWNVRAEKLLRKTANNPAQSSLKDEAARRGNVLGVYEPEKGANITGRRVLLVDDVLTTGSTLTECVRVLRMAGAESVVCATLAVSKKEKKAEEK